MSRLLYALLFIVLLVACQSNEVNTISKEEQVMDEQLIVFAEEGNVDAVAKMLKNDVNMNIQDENGRTAVLAATLNQRTDIVKQLIEAGADIDLRDHRQDNVLLYAGAAGYLDIVKMAVEAGADPKITNRFGGIALIPAAERGHVEVVEYLLEYSESDVNHINHLQWTALLEAIILGDGGEKHQQIVKLLLEHDADVKIADGDGVKPLEHAEKFGYEEIIKLLKEYGA